MSKKEELVFVYNATLNPLALAGDFIAEIMPQKETNCNLCSLTFSLVYKKKAWRNFIRNLDIDVSFLTKDRFLKKHTNFSRDHEFPAVFLLNNDGIQEVIKADEINNLNDLDELIETVKTVAK